MWEIELLMEGLTDEQAPELEHHPAAAVAPPAPRAASGRRASALGVPPSLTSRT